MKRRLLPRFLAATLVLVILSSDISAFALSDTTVQQTEGIEEELTNELQQTESVTEEKEVDIEGIANFSHLILLVQFADTKQEHSYASDILEIFNGTEESSEGLRQYLYALSENTLKIENLIPQYDTETNKFSVFTLENTEQYYAENENALLEEVALRLNSAELLTEEMILHYGNEESRLDWLTILVPDEAENETVHFETHVGEYQHELEEEPLKIGEDSIVNYQIVTEADLYSTEDSYVLISQGIAEHLELIETDVSESEDKVSQDETAIEEELLTEPIQGEAVEVTEFIELDLSAEIEDIELQEEIITGIQTVDGKTYICNERGELQTGYFEYNGQKYCADNNGVLKSGWIKLGDVWRYFDPTNSCCEVESETTDGYWYYLEDERISYFDKKTTLVQNCWKTISNQKYYFDDEGFVVKGWHQDGAYWYYAKNDGQMVKGTYTTEDEKTYYFDSNYRLSTGWKKIDGIYRYFNVDENHTKCNEIVFDNTIGWATSISDGRKCYIDKKNGAVKGWKNIDGYRYHFDSNGFLDTGLFQDGRYHYYAETTTETSPMGNVVKGAKKIGESIYGFHPTKYYRLSGWQTLDGQKYFFKDDYSAVIGWYQEGDCWYYAEQKAESEELQLVPEGAMAKGEKTIGGHTYYFDSKYHLVTGWVKINKIWRYFQKGELPKNCYEIETVKNNGWMTLSDGTGRIAYINEKNNLVKGFQTINDHRYYFDADGFLVIGWFEVGGKKYYAETESTLTDESPLGNVVKGVKEIDGVTYVFHSKSYYSLKGWQTVNGKKYYLNADGSVHTGWYKEGSYWYYVDSECVRAKGESEIKGNIYYFDSNYRLKTGWIKLNNIWRYFDTAETPENCYEIKVNKENSWLTLENGTGRKSYVNAKNALVKGWLNLPEGKYYFDSNGMLQTGWYTVGSGKYHADENGLLLEQVIGQKNTWWENEGKIYYFNSKGQLLKGFQTINKQRFYFDSEGALKTGWFEVKGKTYYGEPTTLEDGTLQGALTKGAKEIENAVYVFHSSQYYRLSGFQNAGCKRFYLDPENECRAKFDWFEVKGKIYYGEPLTLEDGTLQGTLAKGAKEIENNTYVFHSSKYYRLTGFQSSGGKRYYLQSDGKARAGWFTVGTDLYYGEPETTEDGILKGTLASGAKEIERANGSATYLFHTKSNYRLTGWQTVNKRRYYLKADGMARTGWFTVSGKTYFAEPETTEDGILKGTVAVGAKEIDGKTYVFHSSKYYRLVGWQTVNKKKYYLKSDGTAETGWFKVSGKWYYGEPETTEEGILRGTLAAGFKNLNVIEDDIPVEHTYYFDSNCRLVTGWTTISKIRYFFQKNTNPEKCYLICKGPSKTGWFTFEDGRKSYLNSKGKFVTGWQTISKKKYYFDSVGIMQTGWCTISGKEYYFNSEGSYIPLTTPSITAVTSTEYEVVDVKWKAISGVKSYVLQYSKENTFPSWSTKNIYITDASATEYRVEGLEGNEIYYFRLRYTVWDAEEAVSEVTNSTYSAFKNVTVQGEVEPTATAAEISECVIISGNRSTGITVNLKASFGHRRIKSADGNYYIVETESYGNEIDLEEPVAEIAKSFDIDITFDIGAGDGSENVRQAVAIALMNKFALAIKNEDGSYQLISVPMGITNPEFISENKAEIFKPVSKKGIQAVNLDDRRGDGSPKPTDDNAYGSNTKNTLMNIHLNDLVGTSEESGFKSYEYKGKTYYFSNCATYLETVRNLVEGYPQYIKPGVTATNQVAVTFVLLLEYDDATKYLINPSARAKGHKYYTLNVREEEARETLEALFLYLGELFGQNDCYVTHWILGNEVNSSKAWNYQGSLSFSNYMKSYASAFRLLYNGVKAGKTGNNVYISLDNGWAASPDTYSGKSTLDKFAEYAQLENEDMLWSIAYHGYSYPLTRNDFWNDSTNTTFKTNTKYISMKNISVLTDYAAALEDKYDKPSGSIRVILSEQGYNGKSNPTSQAQALARGYYMAEFNDRIDAFIIRAIIDDQDETVGGLYLGIRKLNHEKRIAYFVYEYMDSNLEYMSQLIPEDIVSSGNVDKFAIAQKILCETNWENIIPGFSYEKLAVMH